MSESHLAYYRKTSKHFRHLVPPQSPTPLATPEADSILDATFSFEDARQVIAMWKRGNGLL